MKLKVLEKDVQASCFQYLAMKKVFFFRLNNMPVYTDGHFRRLPEHTPRGLPDCVVIIKGKFIGLEFKGSVGKLSPEQIEVCRNIVRAGGDYYLIRSIDDLQKIGI